MTKQIPKMFQTITVDSVKGFFIDVLVIAVYKNGDFEIKTEDNEIIRFSSLEAKIL